MHAGAAWEQQQVREKHLSCIPGCPCMYTQIGTGPHSTHFRNECCDVCEGVQLAGSGSDDTRTFNLQRQSHKSVKQKQHSHIIRHQQSCTIITNPELMPQLALLPSAWREEGGGLEVDRRHYRKLGLGNLHALQTCPASLFHLEVHHLRWRTDKEHRLI